MVPFKAVLRLVSILPEEIPKGKRRLSISCCNYLKPAYNFRTYLIQSFNYSTIKLI